jgi:hypothetical protein
MNLTRTASVMGTLFCLCASSFAASPITPEEVWAAQRTWGDAIVAIGETYERGDDYQSLAKQTIETLYGYDLGPVLFKPTKAATEPFRPTLESALSYFVKGSVPEDHGFALQPWSQVRFGDQELFIDSDSAETMGHYYFTDAHSGEETKVEFSLGYLKDAEGHLRIFLHHSSLPYAPHP